METSSSSSSSPGLPSPSTPPARSSALAAATPAKRRRLRKAASCRRAWLRTRWLFLAEGDPPPAEASSAGQAEAFPEESPLKKKRLEPEEPEEEEEKGFTAAEVEELLRARVREIAKAVEQQWQEKQQVLVHKCEGLGEKCKALEDAADAAHREVEQGSDGGSWPGPDQPFCAVCGEERVSEESGDSESDCCGGPFDECECWEKCGRWAHWRCAGREPAVHEGIGVRFWSGWWRQGPGHWCPVCMGSPPPPPKKTTASEEKGNGQLRAKVLGKPRGVKGPAEEYEETFYQAKYGEEEDPEEEGLTVKPSREDEEECKQQ